MASGRVPNTVKIFIKLLCVFRVNSYQTGAFLELAFRQSPRHFSQFQLRESTLHRFFFHPHGDSHPEQNQYEP